MPGFKASEDRLTLLLGANAAHEVSVHLPFKKKKKNPKALNYSKSTLPVLYKWSNKAG